MAKLTLECNVTVKWWFEFAVMVLRFGAFFGFKLSDSRIEKLAISATVVKVISK